MGPSGIYRQPYNAGGQAVKSREERYHRDFLVCKRTRRIHSHLPLDERAPSGGVRLHSSEPAEASLIRAAPLIFLSFSYGKS